MKISWTKQQIFTKFCSGDSNRCCFLCVKFYLNCCRFPLVIATCLEGSLFCGHTVECWRDKVVYILAVLWPQCCRRCRYKECWRDKVVYISAVLWPQCWTLSTWAWTWTTNSARPAASTAWTVWTSISSTFSLSMLSVYLSGVVCLSACVCKALKDATGLQLSTRQVP